MRNENTPYLAKNEPIGTNLLCADQAKEMIEFVLKDIDFIPRSTLQGVIEGMKEEFCDCSKDTNCGDCAQYKIVLTDLEATISQLNK